MSYNTYLQDAQPRGTAVEAGTLLNKSEAPAQPGPAHVLMHSQGDRTFPAMSAFINVPVNFISSQFSGACL